MRRRCASCRRRGAACPSRRRTATALSPPAAVQARPAPPAPATPRRPGTPASAPAPAAPSPAPAAPPRYVLQQLESKKGSPYSITERRFPELIPVLGSQPAGDVSHKPGGRLSLLFARPAVTLTTLKRAATNFAAW